MTAGWQRMTVVTETIAGSAAAAAARQLRTAGIRRMTVDFGMTAEWRIADWMTAEWMTAVAVVVVWMTAERLEGRRASCGATDMQMRSVQSY